MQGEPEKTSPASRRSDARSLRPPPLIIDGRYEVRAELGRGGMGVIYGARDVGLARDVAVKMVAAELISDQRIVAGLQREARALAQVRSPHVVQVFAFGRHGETFYFVMERVRGRTLSEIVEAHAAAQVTVPFARVLRIFEQVAAGLAAVHAQGILHLDVKPSNVMIEDETGRPVLIDFGLAVTDASPSKRGAGTPGYMAPEQSRVIDEPVSERSDMYGLGCTAFAVLAGVAPFKRRGQSTLQAQLGEPPLLSRHRPELAHLDPVFAKVLAARPSDRYESCEAFLDSLAKAKAAGGNSPGAAPTPSLNTSAERPALAPSSRPAPPGLSVLVLDEDTAESRLVSSAARIALFGQRVRVETNAGGLASARRAPDLLLIRASAPAYDSLEKLGALRELPGGRDTKVIVLSGADTLRLVQFRFSLLGVKHFLPSPATLQALVDSIGAIADASGWRDRRDPSADPEETA